MNSKAKLIRDFFGLSGGDAIVQIKALTELDRLELASAIARERGLVQTDCDFTFVPY